MFSDKSFDSVGFQSSWQSHRSLQEAESQTESNASEEKETQAKTSNSVEIQTDSEASASTSAPSYDEDRLAQFLSRICPVVIKELDKVNRCRAFDGYKPIQDEDGEMKKIHTLTAPKKGFQSTVKVSSLTWSSTGSVIALGFCCPEHESWCDHGGSVHLFNINRQDFSPTTPYKSFDTSACVTSVCAHPYDPSVLAAATFSGEVIVWNLQSDEDTVLGSSATLPDSHQDTVTQLSWVRDPDPTHQRPLLVSSGREGRLLMWKVGHHVGSFQSVDRFVITMAHIKVSGSSHVQVSPLVGRNEMELGVSCFSFSISDPSVFIIGMENGSILHCSTLSTKPAAVAAEGNFKDPVLNVYKGHVGSVTSLQCSTIEKDMFISCGVDKEIHVYRTNQVAPVQVFYCTSDVSGLQWSPFQSSLFAYWGSAGTVYLCNVENINTNILKLSPPSGKCVPITAAQFNPRSGQLLAVGDTDGQVGIWQIPLTTLFEKPKH